MTFAAKATTTTKVMAKVITESFAAKRFFAFTSPTSILLSENVNKVPNSNDNTNSKAELNKKLRHQIKTRDISLSIPSIDNTIRVTFCSATHSIREVIRRHDLLSRTHEHKPFLQLLGTQVLFTNLLSALQEGEERVECKFTANESTIVSEALALGECRCYVSPLTNEELVKQGGVPFTLQVKRTLYNLTPFTSTTNVVLDEIIPLNPCTSKNADNTTSNIISDNSNNINSKVTQANASYNDNNTVKEEAVASFPLLLPIDVSMFHTSILENYYKYNLTLHAYNWLRRSNGECSSVGLLTLPRMTTSTKSSRKVSEVDVESCNNNIDTNSECKEQSKELKSNEANSQICDEEDKLTNIIANAFGVLVTPLAAGEQAEAYVLKLQSALVKASLCCSIETEQMEHNSEMRELAKRLAELRRDWEVHHTICQDILSLITGDYHGSHAATRSARQYTTDNIDDVREKIEPIRQLLQIDERTIPLNASQSVRTAIDFFCRCNKENIKHLLVNVDSETWAPIQTHKYIRCVFCGKQHEFSDEEWRQMELEHAKVHHNECELLLVGM